MAATKAEELGCRVRPVVLQAFGHRLQGLRKLCRLGLKDA
jgi:hypothetical protein